MNHFLLTGNELVADWPEHPYLFYASASEYANRPRYTCSKELLAMLKEGERYELDKHFTLEKETNGRDYFMVAVPVDKGEELRLKMIPNNKKASHLNSLTTEVCRLRLENNILKQKLRNIKNIIG